MRPRVRCRPPAWGASVAGARRREGRGMCGKEARPAAPHASARPTCTRRPAAACGGGNDERAPPSMARGRRGRWRGPGTGGAGEGVCGGPGSYGGRRAAFLVERAPGRGQAASGKRRRTTKGKRRANLVGCPPKKKTTRCAHVRDATSSPITARWVMTWHQGPSVT